MTTETPVMRQDSPDQAVVLHLDKSVGKQFITVLWISALISGMALSGLIGTCFFIYKNIGYTAVLEYDLMDLRAKFGAAHENTPAPPEVPP
jgi:hypothetical protein